MAYTATRLTSNKVKLTFDVPAETLEAAIQSAYLKNRGRINVPGFRKGKAPRRLIENMYGEAIFYDDAFDAIFPDLYDEAVAKKRFSQWTSPMSAWTRSAAGRN